MNNARKSRICVRLLRTCLHRHAMTTRERQLYERSNRTMAVSDGRRRTDRQSVNGCFVMACHAAGTEIGMDEVPFAPR